MRLNIVLSGPVCGRMAIVEQYCTDATGVALVIGRQRLVSFRQIAKRLCRQGFSRSICESCCRKAPLSRAKRCVSARRSIMTTASIRGRCMPPAESTPTLLRVRGERMAHEVIGEFWQRALILANDGEFGLKLGRAAKPRDFFVLGYSWSASDTLLGAIDRMIRYEKVVTSPYSTTSLERVGDAYRITESFEPETPITSPARGA